MEFENSKVDFYTIIFQRLGTLNYFGINDKSYNEGISKLKKTLSQSQQEILREILNGVEYIIGQKQERAYKLGFNDAVELWEAMRND